MRAVAAVTVSYPSGRVRIRIGLLLRKAGQQAGAATPDCRHLIPMSQERKHKDTRVSLDGMTIEEALKKVIDAGPYPKTKKEPKKAPSRSSQRTKPADRQPDRKD